MTSFGDEGGFTAPVRAWLAGDLKPCRRTSSHRSESEIAGCSRHRKSDRLITANEAGTEDNALRIWALITLELWQRTFIDREDRVLTERRCGARSGAPSPSVTSYNAPWPGPTRRRRARRGSRRRLAREPGLTLDEFERKGLDALKKHAGLSGTHIRSCGTRGWSVFLVA